MCVANRASGVGIRIAIVDDVDKESRSKASLL
jgi:hypothetical protein